MEKTPLLRVVLEAPTDGTLEAGDAGSTPADERAYELLSTLLDRGFQVSRAARPATEEAGGETPADLARLAPLDASRLVVLREGCGDAEGELPAPDLETPSVEKGGSTDAPTRVWVRDIAERDNGAVADAVERIRDESGSYKNEGWKPWFPVIDYERCTNCMQCLSFCLFDVYGVDSEQVIQVQNEAKCKTNCPACSRVCPEVAILFPKYGQGPINGADVEQDDVDREKMKIDVSALLGGDIYSLLRQRHEKARSRFSKERDSEKALKERQRCLKKLQGAMSDIPPEVMMALPSADEIRQKAAAAAERAQQALDARAGLEKNTGRDPAEG